MEAGIMNLPNELIANIFSFVTRKHDRRNLTLVCKKFHLIIRRQSKPYQILLNLFKPGADQLVPVFELSDIFPFQKANVEAVCLSKYREFWHRFGSEFLELEISMVTESDSQNFYKTIGDIIELFPNLQTLNFQGEKEVSAKDLRLLPVDTTLPSLEQLKWDLNSLQCINSVIKHFPSLKRLDLTLRETEKHLTVEEFRDLLNEWMKRLHSIELTIETTPLLEAFDGLESEKINFSVRVSSPQKVEHHDNHLKTLKDFFSIHRIIREMEVTSPRTICNESLIALMNQNAKIDVLRVIEYSKNQQSYERLYNLGCIKEIHILQVLPRFIRNVNFSPETLSKVTELGYSNLMKNYEGDKIDYRFKNLRRLSYFVARPGELQCIAENFPKLTELRIEAGFLDENKLDGSSFSALKNLEQLEIIDCFLGPLNDDFLDKGLRLPNLKRLKIFFHTHQISIKGIQSLASHCPRLASLDLAGRRVIFENDEDRIKCKDYLLKNHLHLEKIIIDSK